MENILMCFAFLLGIIVLFSLLNEKIFKIPNDIALVFFGFLVFVAIKIVISIFNIDLSKIEIYNLFKDFDLASFITEGILCFMLFAGSSKIKFNKFVDNIKPILILSFGSTLISSFLYGFMFYGISKLLNLGIDNIWVAILLGCIVSPTDPIAATGILNKLGLSKNVSLVIEGESLFNDGVGVALFVFFKDVIISSATTLSITSFLILLIKKVFGALILGYIICYIMFKLFKISKDPTKHIFISMLTVLLCFLICESLGFSGVIASVVCGIYFSYNISKNNTWIQLIDIEKRYENFWGVIDSLLNSILFALMGIYVLYLPIGVYTLLVMIIAIILNLITRFSGVYISSFAFSTPNRYTKFEFASLLSWCGLKGGLSLALALSTSSIFNQNQLSTYNILLWVAFATMFFTIVIQGLTAKNVYYAVEKNKAKREKEDFERRKV